MAKNSWENPRWILGKWKIQNRVRNYFILQNLHFKMRTITRRTFNFQKVMSLWHKELQIIRIRTSRAIGGATTISSITSGSPGFRQTAANKFQNALKHQTFQRRWGREIQPKKDHISEEVPLQRSDWPPVAADDLSSMTEVGVGEKWFGEVIVVSESSGKSEW